MPTPNKFGIQHKKQNNISCLYLEGYLDAHTAPDLENKIGELVSQGEIKFLINFHDLDYISSAGLGVFMAFIEDVRLSGGDIKMADMKPKVFSVFDLLGFPLLFDIDKEETKVLEKFNTDSQFKNENK